MILTCPACTMRFLVAEGAVGPKGRRVRCANCGHMWMQEPEVGLDEELFAENPPEFLDASLDDDNDPFYNPVDNSGINLDNSESDTDFQNILRKEIESSPIPDGVKPDMDDPVLAELGKIKKASAKQNMLSPAKLGGYMAALFIFLLMIGGALFFQPTISRIWPPSNAFYDVIGMKPVLPGDGLTLEDLSAEIQGDKIFLSGRIINLKSSDTPVPTILANIVDDNGQSVERVLIAPPVTSLKPEGTVPFDHVYLNRPENAVNVTFSFTFLNAKAPLP